MKFLDCIVAAVGVISAPPPQGGRLPAGRLSHRQRGLDERRPEVPDRAGLVTESMTCVPSKAGISANGFIGLVSSVLRAMGAAVGRTLFRFPQFRLGDRRLRSAA